MPLPAQAHFEIFSLLSNFHLLEMQIFALWTRRAPVQDKVMPSLILSPAPRGQAGLGCWELLIHQGIVYLILMEPHQAERETGPTQLSPEPFQLKLPHWPHREVRLLGIVLGLSLIMGTLKERTSPGPKFPFWGFLAAASSSPLMDFQRCLEHPGIADRKRYYKRKAL